MVFTNAASKKEVELGEKIGVEAGGKKIFIANLEGNYYAMGSRCTHMGCMLSEGELKGETVQCRCHGSIFDIRTGKVVKGPAMRPEPVFQVKVEGDQILVNV